MLIRFDTAPDRRRLTAATRRHGRANLLTYRVVGIFVGLFDVWWFTRGGDKVAGALLAGYALCCLLLLPEWGVRRAVRESWRTFGLPVTWELSEAGIRRSTAVAEGLIRWEAVRDVLRMPDQLVLRITKKLFIPVPIVDLTAEQRDEFLTFLRERDLLGGRNGSAPGAGPGSGGDTQSRPPADTMVDPAMP